jgi:flagellar M-ring protein FliF
VEQFFGALQRFGIGRLAAIIGVSAGAAAALFALVLNMGQEPQGLLFANLDLKEASSITQALDQAGVKYEAKGDGSTLMVARDKVASTRLMLSSKGLPTSGSVGYEIFDEGSALGQTDFVQNLNRQRALEGELARTIKSLNGVASSRVHLVLPKRQLFEEEAEAPSASIVIGLSGRELGPDQVRAVRNLVASAVPNLKPDRVTVVDERGKLLAGGDAESMADQAAEGARTGTEERVRRTVKDLVEGVVGAGKARVQVSADLDLARVTVQEEKYDPDGQVVRSTQTSSENSADSTGAPGGEVSTSENIPGGDPETNAAAAGSQSGKTEETTNYEISRTTRTEVQEPGAIKRLSVAVAVDGVTTVAKDGKVSYAPRSAEEMQRIEQLVRSAVGFSTDRNDQITVVNVRFTRDLDGLGEGEKAGLLSAFDKNDMMRGGEILILAIVAGLIIFFVARPLVKGAGQGSPLRMAMVGPAPVAQGMSGGYEQLPPSAGGDNLALPPPGADMDARIDIARIEGQVKASSVKRVSEFVDKHPDESVSILRSWLHDNA